MSNTGVVASDVAAVGSAKRGPGACVYGGDKAIFSFGQSSATNLVNNSGVVASDVTQVGTHRYGTNGAGYGN